MDFCNQYKQENLQKFKLYLTFTKYHVPNQIRFYYDWLLSLQGELSLVKGGLLMHGVYQCTKQVYSAVHECPTCWLQLVYRCTARTLYMQTLLAGRFLLWKARRRGKLDYLDQKPFISNLFFRVIYSSFYLQFFLLGGWGRKWIKNEIVLKSFEHAFQTWRVQKFAEISVIWQIVYRIPLFVLFDYCNTILQKYGSKYNFIKRCKTLKTVIHDSRIV